MPISIQKRWCKMTKRCEIIIRVVDKKGEAPCHHGHVKGMELSWDHDRGRLCEKIYSIIVISNSLIRVYCM